MSNHTNREVYTKPRYIQRHVGGSIRPIDNTQYMGNQLNLIRESRNQLPQEKARFPESRLTGNVGQFHNQNVALSRSFNTGNKGRGGQGRNRGMRTQKGMYITPPDNQTNMDQSYVSERYDPYTGFLHKKGLIDDGTNRRRFRTSYVDINSAYRNKRAFTRKSDAIQLVEDALDFNAGSTSVFVNHENHPFELGDLIALTGVDSRRISLRTFNDLNEPSFDIPAGCNFMKIFTAHGLPRSYAGDEIEVELRDVRGDRGTVETSSFLGNIPTNVINSQYQLRLTLTQDDVDPNCDLSTFPAGFFDYNQEYFFIVLPTTMHNPSSGVPYTLREYNYTVIFLSLAGVPLGFLNADYPIGPDQQQGFHEIKDIRGNGYFIEVKTAAILDENGGGVCMFVSNIEEVIPGYPDPAHYIIDLGQVFHDVVSARLVSMEYPNSEPGIRDFPEERANNKLYWNDVDDGDFLYSICIPPGNYTPDELAVLMEGLFFETPRVNSGEDVGATYTPNHFIQVEMDPKTDLVTFRSFKEYILVEPIDIVTPEIPQDPALDSNPPNTEYVLTINHPGHGMTVPGERVLIANSISHLGIPTTVVNSEHTVIEIVDENNYKILLPRFNLTDAREDTKGGVAVTIFIPDIFRLRFDQPDTIGGLIGFRNSGEPNSVTPFSRLITNADPYDFQITTNELGEEIVINNNAIQLSGDNYVVMKALPLETFASVAAVKNAFAKIILCDIPGNVIFNSYVATSRFYEDPLHELSELEIEFLSPDGNRIDFNGLDHSFTLEIVTVHDIPEGTGISANTGKNYNIIV